MQSPFFLILFASAAHAFLITTTPPPLSQKYGTTSLSLSQKYEGGKVNREDPSKSAFERIESIKCAITGAVSGGISAAPFTYAQAFLDPKITNSFAQGEFATDMTAIQCSLFAITYRYVVRADVKDNGNLCDGVVAAFVAARSLTSINVPAYCSSNPLDCGGLGYIFDFGEGTTQLILALLSSYVAFGATRSVLDKVRLVFQFTSQDKTKTF